MIPVNYDQDKELIHRFNFKKLIKKTINEIQGISAAIIYDGKLDVNEIELLHKWLIANDEYLTEYPLINLKSLFYEIISDGIVTENERKNLIAFLSDISTKIEGNITLENIFIENPIITFKDKIFVITGDLLFGDRSKTEEYISKLGGINHKRIIKQVNYLIVGGLGSEDFKFSKFGLKIKQAMDYNRNGKSNIQIIKEKHFVEAISLLQK